MRRLLPLVVVLALLPLPVAADGWHAESQGPAKRATVDARAETPDGVVPAVVKVMCRGGADGSVCVSVKVEDRKTVASFDFDAFEGPDAKAAQERLFSGRVGPVSVEGTVSGRIATDPPDAFLFDFCGPSRGANDAKTLAHAIAVERGDVELAVQHPARDGRAIRVKVPAAAGNRDVTGVLRGCPID
jgi:hypothetical protein